MKLEQAQRQPREEEAGICEEMLHRASLVTAESGEEKAQRDVLSEPQDRGAGDAVGQGLPGLPGVGREDTKPNAAHSKSPSWKPGEAARAEGTVPSPSHFNMRESMWRASLRSERQG